MPENYQTVSLSNSVNTAVRNLRKLETCFGRKAHTSEY